MTLADGQIVVRVALELGPNDEIPAPDDAAWTDLTSRVRSYRDRRGRTDVLQPFQPGTADVVLDNGDRMLDPSNPDGYLFNGSDEPIGLPLCPVQIGQMWDGGEYPKFYGYLGPEAWPGDIGTYGPTATVTLHVMDALGHSPSLPGDLWGVLTAGLRPEWWSRMDEFEFPVLDDDSLVPNSIGPGAGVVEGTTGISRPYVNATPGEVSGIMSPGLRLSGDHKVRFSSSDIMPDGDETEFSTWLWWAAVTPIGTADSAMVAEMVNPSTDVPRWSIYVDGDDGFAYVTTYDGSGTVIDTGTIEPFAGPRWDQVSSIHLVVARFDTNKLKVWFGGVSVELDATTNLYESDLILGPSDVDVVFDEVATWRRALSYADEIAPAFLALGYGGAWTGDTWAQRLTRWVETTGRDVSYDDSGQWHLPSGTDHGLWGLNRPHRPDLDIPFPYIIELPDNLADAYQITAQSGGGSRWATKDGFLRFRTIHALTDPTYAEFYSDTVTFTDADATLDTGEFRHAGVEVTGLRIDRVINDASVSYMYGPMPLDGTDYSPLTNRALDIDSRNRYGLRTHEIQTAWCDWVLNQTMADQIVTRFAQPRQEIEVLHLDPLGPAGTDGEALAEWLVTTCELELACNVAYTPFDSDPVTVTELNIQQIEFTWTPERWSVDLMVAAS